MYPRIVIDMNKLRGNLDAVAKITNEGGCSLMIVTKGVCADEEITKMIARHPAVSYMADSRIENLRKYAADAREHGKQTVLLRLP
nr:alanine/ornithine racemase family PLP-dependent enzyme [Clostridiales bacterium]